VPRRAARLHGAGAWGAALSAWAADGAAATALHLGLEGNAVEAGRAVSLRGVGGRVTVAARRNEVAFGEAVLAVGGRSPGWRARSSWQDDGNAYCGAGPWLRAEDGPAVRDLSGWLSFWQGGAGVQ
jgi:hypothetical protein